MDLNTVGQIISTIGFPAFCCVYMAWYINKQDEKHNAETNKLSDALNTMNVLLTKLVDRLEVIERALDNKVDKPDTEKTV